MLLCFVCVCVCDVCVCVCDVCILAPLYTRCKSAAIEWSAQKSLAKKLSEMTEALNDMMSVGYSCVRFVFVLVYGCMRFVVWFVPVWLCVLYFNFTVLDSNIFALRVINIDG